VVGGEAEVVIEDGQEDDDHDEKEDDADGAVGELARRPWPGVAQAAHHHGLVKFPRHFIHLVAISDTKISPPPPDERRRVKTRGRGR
jgi:hypothetical protein